ncbi:NADP-dependent glyceraldehyde-3-phosphate dehydrogenase [Sneathia sanguinegens]|uniref:NADP-dependent glyceraldehyde-3-phosphate dehydrogenase n=1 Tax=Sneathia sanguinegens TaxID=40543 RepID=A0ABT7HIM8_9FUSO|nr:NADP-dependent glyceraldehyde-3-phosphate dehydrogenase [Sneathia sanguinegens]MDK9580029.1 NADP-dependent glyceraldehyde-3-phosphate dehydrogenase [Sneathia sanguinegens]
MDKIQIYSPIDGKLLGEVEAMTKEEIEEKIQKLKKAYKTFSELDILKRANYLRKASELIKNRAEDLAKLMTVEISKPYKDSLTEVLRSVEMMDYTIEEALRIQNEVYSGESFGSKDKVCLSLRQALGIILCIAPFNYPINLSLSKIVPALIMGNVVLFKPPTQGSLVCSEMVKILNEVLPEDVLTIATGRGSVIGDYINTHKDIAFINFTGSTQIGKRISNQADLKGLMMELGGKDAAIVLKDADLSKAASEIVKGAFSYSGQRCTAIKRVLVDKEVKEELVSKICDLVDKLKVGHPMDNADITPLIDSKSADFVQSLIDDAIDKNANVLRGNKRKQNLIYPCILDNVTLDMKVAFEEPFGPVLPIITVANVDEAIEIANMSNYGLQSAIFTKDITKAFEIAKKLEVGTVHINNKTQRGPDNFPFLGIKDSGIGVQGIRYSILSMTRLKNIVFDM